MSWRLALTLFDNGVQGKSLSEIPQLIANIINILMFFVGALSVIFIIIGGIKYATSAGNPQGLASAKRTLMYAIGGLVLAVLAFTIVSFAQGLFK